jgi:CRISPR type IV-associated protein Csf1
MSAGRSLTSAVIVAKALGYQPDGVPAEQAGVCALCGLEIKQGDLCSPLSLGAGFVDDHDMVGKGSKILCAYCPEAKTAVGLRETGFGVFSAAGVQPFRKWQDIVTAVIDPPQPPFVMTYATADNQHMAWRAPVNLSREMFYVRVGLRDVKIRRQVLLDAVEHCRILGEALFANRKVNPDKKTLPHPFMELSTDLKSPNMGRLNPKVFSLEFDHLDQHRKALMALTIGEVWALRFVLTPGAGT